MRRIASFGLAALMVLGCHRGGQKSGPVLAKGEGFEITAGEFKARIDEQPPFQRARYAVPGKRKEYLDRMIQEEILFRQAKEEGLEKDPQFQQFVRGYLANRLMQKHAHQTDPSTIPAADVQKYFDEHATEYQKRVSASVVSFYVAPAAAAEPEPGKKAPPPAGGYAERAKKVAAARVALANLRAAERDPKQQAQVAGLFQKLVTEVSVDDPAVKRTDPMLRTQEEIAKTRGPELAARIFGMKQNEISDVVETDKGVYLVRVNAVREPIGLEQVRPSIQLRLARMKDEKDRMAFVQQLREAAKVSIDEQALEAVPLAPVQPAAGAPQQSPTPPAPPQAEASTPATKVEPAVSKPAGK